MARTLCSSDSSKCPLKTMTRAETGVASRNPIEPCVVLARWENGGRQPSRRSRSVLSSLGPPVDLGGEGLGPIEVRREDIRLIAYEALVPQNAPEAPALPIAGRLFLRKAIHQRASHETKLRGMLERRRRPIPNHARCVRLRLDQLFERTPVEFVIALLEYDHIRPTA